MTTEEEAYLGRLNRALKQCVTKDQYRSVYKRAEIDTFAEAAERSPGCKGAINRLVAQERDRIEELERTVAAAFAPRSAPRPQGSRDAAPNRLDAGA